jgi:TrkA domain protein
MTEVNETPMPGLGTRYTMATRSSRSVGVVVHQTGRRDLVIYDEADVDATAASIDLTEDEARALAELLGGSRIVERLNAVSHHIEGLVIDWVRIDETSPVAGQTLQQADLRAKTAASVMAIVHGTHAVPGPGGSDTLDAGATAVVVGTEASVTAIRDLLLPRRA